MSMGGTSGRFEEPHRGPTILPRQLPMLRGSITKPSAQRGFSVSARIMVQNTLYLVFGA